MKKNQVLLRQIKGLNLKEHKFNLWVYYFTLPTSKLLSSIPKNSKLNAHYSNFNFADVNLKSLSHQSSAIESNPAESLTTLLHFNQPISQHYFKFCNLLLEINVDKNILTKVIDEVSIQLIRALLAFNFQFEHEMDNIKNKKESAFFPFHYLEDFPNLVKVLLMTSKIVFPDFLYLLSPILILLFPLHETDSIVYETSQKVYTVLLEFLENHSCNEDEILPIVSYVIDVSCSSHSDSEKFSNLCKLFSGNNSVHHYISQKSYSTFIKKSKFTFEQICDSKPNASLFENGLTLMKALGSTLDKVNENMSVEISPFLLSFIEWSIKFDHLPEITAPTIQKRTILDRFEFKTDYQFEFYDCEMFDRNLDSEQNSGLRSVSPIYLANSLILTSIVGITAEICSKNESILSDIILNFPRKSLIDLYVTVSIIFLCRPSCVGELLTKTNTWDVFVNTSIINDSTLFGREGVDENIENLKDLILSILFNLSTKEAAASLCGLLDPNYPTVVFKIVELLNMMMNSEFIKQCQETSLFDTLMMCYDTYRCYLVKHKKDQENEDITYMKKSKSLILTFINTFSLCDESKLFIFSNNKRAYFVLSLLFEKYSFEMALDIVCRALETEYVNLLMRHLNKLIKFGFHHLEIVDWQELISVLIDCVSVSISVNEKNLMKSFIKSGSIYTFSRIPAAYSENKNCQGSVRTVLHKIICFFTSLVQNMKNVVFYLSDSQWNFVANLGKAIKSIDITAETVDLLINFTVCSDTLWIKEGVELLMIALEKKEVSTKILSFLVASTNTSIANRYQCFKANVITSLLSFILKISNQQSIENSDQKTVEDLTNYSLNLLKNVCSSFFRVGELSLTVRIISQTNNELAISLLNSLLELCEQQSLQFEDHNFSSQMAIQSSSTIAKKPSAPKAFFHFTTSSVFSVSEFYIPSTFNISMKVFFPREIKKMKQLFIVTTASCDQQIEMNVVLNRLIVEVKNKGRKNQFQMFNKVKVKEWFGLELALTTSTVTLFINSNQETSSVIPKKFRFEHPVLFFIQEIDADIQSINIFSREYDIFSSYDAKIVNERNAVNIAVGSSIPNAVFYGIPVPFCITFIDIIPSCGGPKIFLPLFENLKSVELFKKLLCLLDSLIREKEAIFNPSFFRSLAHLLSRMTSEFFTDESLNLILQIYKSIWNTPLRSSMLKFIFGNIDLWSKLSQESQLLLFSNIFTGLFEIDSTLFVKTLNFHTLLLKFSLFFDLTSTLKLTSLTETEGVESQSNENDENELKIMKETTDFLFMISQRSFTPNDAKTLTAAAMDINSNDMCIKSLHLIIKLFQDNCPGMIAYLKKYSFFQPFISILNSHSERTRIIAMNCIYIVQSTVNDSLLSEELIDGIRLLNVLDMTNVTLFNLMSYMTKSLTTKNFPTIVSQFNFIELKPIFYPQFLPLFVTVVALLPENVRSESLSFVRRSIANFEETRKSFANCNFWPFWIIFMCNADKEKNEEWMRLMVSIVLANENVISSVYNLLLFCQVFGINIVKEIDEILVEAIVKKPSPRLALFVIKYVLFRIEAKEKEKKPDLDDSIHKFCQEFVLADCPSFVCKYKEFITNQNDLKMLSAAVQYLITQNQLFGTQKPQLQAPQIQQQANLARRNSQQTLNKQFLQQANIAKQSSQQIMQQQAGINKQDTQQASMIKQDTQNNMQQQQTSHANQQAATGDSIQSLNISSSSSFHSFADEKFDVKNKIETNLALVCLSIITIAQQDKELSLPLHNLLITSVRKLQHPFLIKDELRKTLLLLHHFYSRNRMQESDSIVYTIRQIDVNYSNIISPEKMMTISENAHNSFINELPTFCMSFQNEFNTNMAALHKKAQSAIQRVFAEEDQKLSQLRNNFTKKLTNSAQEQERFLKGNRKFYEKQLKEMSIQNGGPWFSIPPTPHFKFNFVLDRIGRHNKMSVNFKFEDHKMASILRDTGIESTTVPTATTTANTDNNVKIIKGMRIDVSNEVESPNDFTIELECQMVKTAKYFKGKMYLTQSSIYFEVRQTTDAFGEIIDKMSKLIEINVEHIKFILKRRYLFVDTACEVFTTYNKSYFFVFATIENRFKFFKEIESFKLKNIEFIQFESAPKLFKELQLQKKWNSGQMSNYEYLTWLNMLAGRSIHDISQYPVFPWVISDYESQELNLQDERIYRDLSKPIGTLNKERLDNLKYLYNETRKASYACLYRFHYSTPAYVIAFLLRNEPFTSLHIQLQNGKFDNPNRLVYSIPMAWESVTSVNSDFRELIPEFFATPEFLLNSEHYDLGKRVDLVPIKKSASFNAEVLSETVKLNAEKASSKTAASCQSLPEMLSKEKEESQMNQPNKGAEDNSNDNSNHIENSEGIQNSEHTENLNCIENSEHAEKSEHTENSNNIENSDGAVSRNDSGGDAHQPADGGAADTKSSRRKSKVKIVHGKNGELLVNDEVPVDDIILPPWAPSASAFVAIHRIALESPIVSSNLHSWIDLIFGSKQRSEEDDNLFHPFSYLSTLKDEPDSLPIIQQHAANFGITPFQLFKKLHPKRSFIPKSHALNSCTQLFFKSVLLHDFTSPTATTATTASPAIEDDEELMRVRSLNARERSKEKILKIASKSGTFYTLFYNGTFRSFSFNEKRQLVPQKTSSLEIQTHLKRDRVFIDTTNSAIVFSPTWSQSFAKVHKTMIFSPNNSHATAVTAITISSDGCYCITGAGDASLIVWNLREERLQCHLVAHTESIKTVAVSSELEVVASCDEGGTLILSDLKEGKFLRKVKFANSPLKMHISDLGFLALIFDETCNDDDDRNLNTNSENIHHDGEISSVGRRQTKVVLLDMGGRVIGKVNLEGKSTASLIIKNQDETAFLCIAQETKIFYIMRIYDLKIIAMGPVKETVNDISYCKDDLHLYLLLDNNSVHITKLSM